MKRTALLLVALLLVAGVVVADGDWRDGTYTAEEDGYNRGWKNFVRIVVENGYITEAHFDAYAEDGGKNKYLASVQGEYGMVQNGNAQSAWWVQADVAASELINSQDPADFARQNSAVDGISGVSITIMPHFILAEEALSGAGR